MWASFTHSQSTPPSYSPVIPSLGPVTKGASSLSRNPHSRLPLLPLRPVQVSAHSVWLRPGKGVIKGVCSFGVSPLSPRPRQRSLHRVWTRYTRLKIPGSQIVSLFRIHRATDFFSASPQVAHAPRPSEASIDTDRLLAHLRLRPRLRTAFPKLSKGNSSSTLRTAVFRPP